MEKSILPSIENMSDRDLNLLASQKVMGWSSIPAGWNPCNILGDANMLVNTLNGSSMEAEINRNKFVANLLHLTDCTWPSLDGLWKLIQASARQKTIAIVSVCVTDDLIT